MFDHRNLTTTQRVVQAARFWCPTSTVQEECAEHEWSTDLLHGMKSLNLVLKCRGDEVSNRAHVHWEEIRAR